VTAISTVDLTGVTAVTVKSTTDQISVQGKTCVSILSGIGPVSITAETPVDVTAIGPMVVCTVWFKGSNSEV
jgi:uncharacterized protein (DUF2345 family)